MDGPDISIIVPVFNKGFAIKNCIESVVSQKYSSYELLLVDDGSTDESGLICRKYADCDRRVKYFAMENHGVSFARNFGIDRACGKYIAFLDADDELMPQFIESMVNFCDENQLDFASCDVYNASGVVSGRSRKVYVYDVLDRNGFAVDKTVVWGKVFRLGFIIEKRIKFEVRMRVAEDSLFMVECTRLAKRIGHKGDLVGYSYQPTEGGLMNAGGGCYFESSLIALRNLAELSEYNRDFVPDWFEWFDLIWARMINADSIERKKMFEDVSRFCPLDDLPLKSSIKIWLKMRIVLVYLLQCNRLSIVGEWLIVFLSFANRIRHNHCRG